MKPNEKTLIVDKPIPYSLIADAINPPPYRMVVARIITSGIELVETVCRFHCFSTSYEEFDDGAVPYPVAIVETPDGKIYTPPAEFIRFTTGLLGGDTDADTDTDTPSKGKLNVGGYGRKCEVPDE